MLVMVCDLCQERTEHAEVVEYGVHLVDACPRCMQIMAIAMIGPPSEAAWMN